MKNTALNSSVVNKNYMDRTCRISHSLDLDSNVLSYLSSNDVEQLFTPPSSKLFGRDLHIYSIEFIFTSSNTVRKFLKILLHFDSAHYQHITRVCEHGY